MASPARTELFNRCLQGAMEHVKRYDGSHDITHLNVRVTLPELSRPSQANHGNEGSAS